MLPLRHFTSYYLLLGNLRLNSVRGILSIHHWDVSYDKGFEVVSLYQPVWALEMACLGEAIAPNRPGLSVCDL